MGVTTQYTRNCTELQTGRPVTRVNWPQSVTGVKDEGHTTLIEVTDVRQSTHTVWWHRSPENRHFKDAQQLITARTTLTSFIKMLSTGTTLLRAYLEPCWQLFRRSARFESLYIIGLTALLLALCTVWKWRRPMSLESINTARVATVDHTQLKSTLNIKIIRKVQYSH